ncbi:MAG: glycosyltransferase family 1 protein [Candidatus Shapirobacteria bacterium]|nr:glycosyltransferase family 1 protein [Candidatus Shapirobacteria bacterium]
MLIGVDGNEANVSNRVGTGQYTYYLLKHWQKQASSELSFRIYLSSPPKDWLPKKNPYFEYVHFGPKKLWTQIALPIKLFWEKETPDVFFSPAHYAPRIAKTKTVVAIHDLAYLTHPKEFRAIDQKQLSSWTKYSVRKAKKVIAVSHNTKNDLIDFYQLPEEKITVIHNGFDHRRFHPNLTKSNIKNIKEKYQIDGDYLVYLGTLQPRKNIESLIRAFPEIIRKNPNTKLVVIGKKGWLYSTVFSLVQKLNLEKKVIFTDFVPDEEVPFLIAGAQIFVLPSLYEGFGITALEAMACGVPVVVSRVSSLPEVVGDAGLYVDNPKNYAQIAKQINKILADSSLAKKLTKKGINQSKKFSWEKCAEKTLEEIKNTALLV